jgi:hypothetical protein
LTPKIVVISPASTPLLRAVQALSGHGFEIVPFKKELSGSVAAVKQLEADVIVFIPDTLLSSEEAAQITLLQTHPPTTTTPLIVVTASPDGIADLPGVTVIPSSTELLDCVQRLLSSSKT